MDTPIDFDYHEVSVKKGKSKKDKSGKKSKKAETRSKRESDLENQGFAEQDLRTGVWDSQVKRY